MSENVSDDNDSLFIEHISKVFNETSEEKIKLPLEFLMSTLSDAKKTLKIIATEFRLKPESQNKLSDMHPIFRYVANMLKKDTLNDNRNLTFDNLIGDITYYGKKTVMKLPFILCCIAIYKHRRDSPRRFISELIEEIGEPHQKEMELILQSAYDPKFQIDGKPDGRLGGLCEKFGSKNTLCKLTGLYTSTKLISLPQSMRTSNTSNSSIIAASSIPPDVGIDVPDVPDFVDKNGDEYPYHPIEQKTIRVRSGKDIHADDIEPVVGAIDAELLGLEMEKMDIAGEAQQLLDFTILFNDGFSDYFKKCIDKCKKAREYKLKVKKYEEEIARLQLIRDECLAHIDPELR